MEDDYSWSKIFKNYMYKSRRGANDWPIDWYHTEKYEVSDVDPVLYKEQQERYRIEQLPHYVQIYNEDMPGDLVSTKWICYNSYNDVANSGRDIRTMVYQDGNNFYYHKYCKGKSISKPVKLTETETEAFMLVVLKADNYSPNKG